MAMAKSTKRKCRVFIKVLAKRLGATVTQKPKKLKKYFRNAAFSLDGPLKTELLQNEAKYISLYLSTVAKSTDSKGETSSNECQALSCKKRENGLSITRPHPFNLYKKGEEHINNLLEKIKSKEIILTSKECCCLLSQKWKRAEVESTILKHMEGGSWLQDVCLLTTALIGKTKPDKLQHAMVTMFSTLSTNQEELLNDSGKKLKATLKTIKELIIYFHMTHQQCQPFSKPSYEDLMSAILSLYVEIVLKCDDEEPKLELTSFVCMLLKDQHCLDVLLQMTELQQAHAVYLLPLCKKIFSVLTKEALKAPSVYVKYMCAVRLVSKLEGELDMMETALKVPACKGFIEWLSGQDETILEDTPLTSKSKGIEITHFILKEASERDIEGLLNILTADAIEVVENASIEKTESRLTGVLEEPTFGSLFSTDRTPDKNVTAEEGARDVFFIDRASVENTVGWHKDRVDSKEDEVEVSDEEQDEREEEIELSEEEEMKELGRSKQRDLEKDEGEEESGEDEVMWDEESQSESGEELIEVKCKKRAKIGEEDYKDSDSDIEIVDVKEEEECQSESGEELIEVKCKKRAKIGEGDYKDSESDIEIVDVGDFEEEENKEGKVCKELTGDGVYYETEENLKRDEVDDEDQSEKEVEVIEQSDDKEYDSGGEQKIKLMSKQHSFKPTSPVKKSPKRQVSDSSGVSVKDTTTSVMGTPVKGREVLKCTPEKQGTPASRVRRTPAKAGESLRKSPAKGITASPLKVTPSKSANNIHISPLKGTSTTPVKETPGLSVKSTRTQHVKVTLARIPISPGNGTLASPVQRKLASSVKRIQASPVKSPLTSPVKGISVSPIIAKERFSPKKHFSQTECKVISPAKRQKKCTPEKQGTPASRVRRTPAKAEEARQKSPVKGITASPLKVTPSKSAPECSVISSAKRQKVQKSGGAPSIEGQKKLSRLEQIMSEEGTPVRRSRRLSACSAASEDESSNSVFASVKVKEEDQQIHSITAVRSSPRLKKLRKHQEKNE